VECLPSSVCSLDHNSSRNFLGVLGGRKGFDPEMILSLFSADFSMIVQQARHFEHNMVQVGNALLMAFRVIAAPSGPL
jgi:hypothetical protein